MKKLLNILNLVTLVATTSSSVVACSQHSTPISHNKIDISTKINSLIDLGKLSTNTKSAFLDKLQKTLIKISELTAMTTDDYNVYKTGTTNEITDDDVVSTNWLNIEIKAKKESNFIGNINCTTKHIRNLEQQSTIYIDQFGESKITSETDLSSIDTKQIVQIGFYKNASNEIQVVKMSKEIEIVPKQLPLEVTSLSRMFYQNNSLKTDISNWDTSHITNMDNMFWGATFNQDISNWNTANVINMGEMFQSASLFNQDISNWNTANVTNMNGMFESASSFNQNLSSWNVDKVTNYTNFSKNSGITVNEKLPKWKN